MVFAGHLMSTVIAVGLDYFVHTDDTDFPTAFLPLVPKP